MNKGTETDLGQTLYWGAKCFVSTLAIWLKGEGKAFLKKGTTEFKAR